MAPIIKHLQSIDNSLIEESILKLVNQDKDALKELYELTKTAVYGFILSI